MNSGLHAVPDPRDAAPVEVPAEESIDLADDPRTDPEALLLCALMWTTDHTEAQRITAVVAVADFSRATYTELYEHIRDLIAAGRPHDPATVLAELLRDGSAGQHGAPLRAALTDVSLAGADSAVSALAVHYADIVLSQSYRRSFRVMGERLIQSAEQGPEHELMDYTVELGTAQRSAWRRLNAFRAGNRQEEQS